MPLGHTNLMFLEDEIEMVNDTVDACNPSIDLMWNFDNPKNYKYIIESTHSAISSNVLVIQARLT